VSILRNISLFWAMAHTLVLFLMLFESRYSQKKTMAITLATMVPLIVVNSVLSMLMEPERLSMALLGTLSLPSLIVFWLLAKNRDGRFYFTFCLVDTVVLESIYVTQIINYYITPETFLFLFFARLVLYPVLVWLTYKKLRPTYLLVQNYAKDGWGGFAVISALFYVLMTLVMSYPTIITERTEYLPVAAMVFILIPVIYVSIITTLWRQKRLHEMSEQEDILKLQVANMTARIEELAAADERFRIERHNFRHKMKTIASMVELGQQEELVALVKDYNEAYQRTHVIRYCNSAVLDAVLSTYIRQAEGEGIQVTVGFDFPNPIPVDETELATVLANAIENAIHASKKLEESRRHIEVKVLSKPRFMIMIRNNFNGEVEFDEEGIPVNHHEEHGFGTRSIVAFCNKHKAHYLFKTADKTFTLYLNF